MNLLIIEDEVPAAAQLTAFLARAGHPAPPVLRSIAKALAWLPAHPPPDLIFSDIELLDGNVFALYEQFPVACPIIFTTAYDQFLLPAFRGNGIAYLLKPFTYEQLTEALRKYEGLKATLAAPTTAPPTLSPETLRELTQALRQNTQPAYKQRFTVRQRNGLSMLPVADIALLQADEGLVFAHDAAGTRHPLSGTLAEVERQLDPRLFARLNRSELVHISFITKVEPYFNNRLAVHVQGHAAPLITSAAQTPEFRRWLEG